MPEDERATVSPLLASSVICVDCFTFGSLRGNIHGRVIDLNGDAMLGVYAAGETAALGYGDYMGATSVICGILYLATTQGRTSTDTF